MLAIGDIVSNIIDEDFEIKHHEYIINNNQLNGIVKELELEKLVHENNYNITYLKKDKYYTFHLSDNFLMLQKILGSTIADNNAVKIAPLSIEWGIARARVKLIHKDINQWIKRIETFCYIEENYMKYMSPSAKKDIFFMTYNISSWVSNSFGIEKTIYKFREFDIFTKWQIYTTVGERGHSHFFNCIINSFTKTEIFNENSFKQLDHKEKILASLEKIYVETINNFIIPEYEISGRLPDNIYECFMKTYMYIVSSYSNFVFTRFLMVYYNDIMDNYQQRKLSIVFFNAMKYNFIKSSTN